MEKAVGYRVVRQPAQLTLPNKKRFPLEHVCREIAHAKWIDVEIIRAIIGVFSFGALLNRPLFSLLHATYSFLDRYECEVVQICLVFGERCLILQGPSLFWCMKQEDRLQLH